MITSNFLDKVKRTIFKFKMIREREGIVVGVSGGMDSITLLHSLYFIKEYLKINILVAHLNHMVRGVQSEEESRFVESQAKTLNVPCEIENKNIPEYVKNNGLSLQEAAREVRYDFFETVRKKYNFDKIAIAHNRNDQAETVLMRLLRGSGAKGLCGIPPVRKNIIRPLIEISRGEIHDFVNEKKLQYVTDPSNAESYYRRNKIRNELIPYLIKEYNPNILSNLNATAEILRDENNFLEGYLSEILKTIILSEDTNAILVDKKCLKTNHPAIQKRIIRAILEKLKGDLQRITMLHISLIIDLINTPYRGEKSLDLPSKLLIINQKTKLIFKNN